MELIFLFYCMFNFFTKMSNLYSVRFLFTGVYGEPVPKQKKLMDTDPV